MPSRFTPEGRRLDARRIPFAAEPHCGIAVDAAGHLYMVGDPDRRVHKLDREGRVLASFGLRRGEGDGQLFQPIGLTVDAAGRVYVADWLRARAASTASRPMARCSAPGRSATTVNGSGCRRGSRWMLGGGSTWPTATCPGW
jgi:hypothetical protein